MKRTNKRIIWLTVAIAAMMLLFSVSVFAISKGDIDTDKTVPPADARYALRIAVGLPKGVSTDGKNTPIEFTDVEKDIADLDGDFEITPADARVILRIAVGLEQTTPYYEYRLLNPPTCLEQGMNLRTNTEKPFDTYYQYIPALGHDFSDLRIVTKPATCFAPGFGTYKCTRCMQTEEREIIVNHEWSEATCTSPRRCINEGCTAVDGSPLGHTTKLGYCTRCGQYQNLDYEYYNDNIRTPLNNATKTLKEAYNKIVECRTADYTNKTVTLDSNIGIYKAAYNYYYNAYNACEGHDEFKELQKQLYDICQELLKIIYSRDTTAENYETQFTTWLNITNDVLNKRNPELKKITDTFKAPGENSGSGIAVG